MAPLILHNVPDEELYVGDDGIQRPYAMVFPHQEGAVGRASRKTTHETGSFGKSTRRSRSRAATPARREDPTIAAAEKVFTSWIASQAQPQSPDDGNDASQPTTTSGNASPPPEEEETAKRATRYLVPTEVTLRGFRSSQQQYAAINHYEQLAGRILEDYPRDPPAESRRYKSELRDPAYTRRRALNPEERAKVNRAAGGEHWIKVTFESAEDADAAVYASPQTVLGHLVHAELYDGRPPRDEPVVDMAAQDTQSRASFRQRQASAFGTGGVPLSFGGPSINQTMLNADLPDGTPPRSRASSRTVDTGTVASTTETLTTVNDLPGGFGPAGAKGDATATASGRDPEFCRTIPTVRRAKLKPMEEALLPAPSLTQRIAAYVPLLKWWNGTMIGSAVPRLENGEFDWDRASLYWKLMWWLDYLLNLFGGDVREAEKDD